MCSDHWSPGPSPLLSLSDHGPLKCRKHLLHSDHQIIVIRLIIIIIKMANVFHVFLFWLKLTDFRLVMIKPHISLWVIFCYNTSKVSVSLRREETRRELTPGNKVFIGHNNHESIKKKILNLSKTEVINMQPIKGQSVLQCWEFWGFIYLAPG